MLTQRLGSTTQKVPAFIDSLICEITAHPGCCDEVWLATEYGFPSLAVHRQSAETLATVAEKFRAVGVRVSLQLSNSIGHGEYMAKRDCSGLVYEGSPVENMVGHDGTVASYCFCFRGKHFREYLMAEVRSYITAIHPHTLWIDDDLRAENHSPVAFGCFCDDCMDAFNKKYGSSFTRQELVEAINSDVQWRKKHIEFIRSSLYDLTFEISKTVHEADPDCRIGYQHGRHGGYVGYDYDSIFNAMYEATGIAPAHRPGGGAYSDHNINDFLHKGEDINYQNYLLPEYVTEKRPEIESLPDIVYGKSIGGTCFETSYYMAMGNNAMSYAMLMNDYEPMSWHGKMLGAFAQHRKYWEKLCQYNQISHQSGLKVALARQGYLRKTTAPFEYTDECFAFGLPLRFLNIPIAMTREEMPVYLISEEIIPYYSDEEIAFLLTRPVITDGAAIHKLSERGIDVGIDAKPIDTLRLSEAFTAHKINGSFSGRKWGGGWERFSNWELLGDVEAVGRYCAISEVTEHISSGVFTTSGGARWYVGFDLWNRGVSTEKRDQMLNAMEYISGCRFAGELVTPLQAMVYPRVNAENKTVAVSVVNTTVGDSGELELIIRNPAGDKFTLMGQYIRQQPLKAEQIAEGEYRVMIPDIHGWSVATVFVE